MKAKLEFDLPDDEDAFKMATRGREYFCALWDLKNLLREYEKYDMVVDVFVERYRDIIYDVILDDIS